jgi:DNA-binding CsgD family transcriptional regulator
LRSLCLLRPSLESGRDWDAVPPEAALAVLLADEEAKLSRRQVELTKVRADVLRLLPTYAAARREYDHAEPVQLVEDVLAVRQLLARWSQRVEHDVRIAHPGRGLSDAGLARSLRLDLPVLHRGVTFRTVLQHAARQHQPTRHYVNAVCGFGAAVRTVPVVPRKLIVFDDDIAFMPLAGDRPEQGAVLVQHPAMLDYLTATFDALWLSGQPFADDRPGSGIRDELSQTILQLLAVGAKDEVIARRLGLSVRTCRRHIAAIMDELGACSRFQAGLLAGRQGVTSGSDTGEQVRR